MNKEANEVAIVLPNDLTQELFDAVLHSAQKLVYLRGDSVRVVNNSITLAEIYLDINTEDCMTCCQTWYNKEALDNLKIKYMQGL